jgi:asparagine synthase (glutamine-hydrolysing)
MRAPAFDQRLFELCIGIPEDQYLRKGCQSWLIKRAMQGRLPDIVLSNTRRGAQAADWFARLTRERKQIAAELNRLTGNPEVSSIIDLPRLIEVLDHWPERQLKRGPPTNICCRGSAGSGHKFHRSTTGVNYR